VCLLWKRRCQQTERGKERRAAPQRDTIFFLSRARVSIRRQKRGKSEESESEKGITRRFFSVIYSSGAKAEHKRFSNFILEQLFER